MCELPRTYNHHYFDGNNKGALYPCTDRHPPWDPLSNSCPLIEQGWLILFLAQIRGVLPGRTNHDALEFPDGKIVLLTRLYEGQNAIVLTLPSLPKTAAEAETQERVAYVG
jgi:hypothetical protein